MGSPSVIKRIKEDFPDLRYIEEKLFVPVYSKLLPAWMKILFQAPFIFKSERSSFSRLQIIVKQEGINLIISDNRYFIYSGLCRSILISHQLNPRMPFILRWLQPLAEKRIATLCKPFQEVWAPDSGIERPLSGELSVNRYIQGKLRFCGFLSRFSFNHPEKQPEEYDLLILSGPAPQPEILYKRVVALYLHQKVKLKVISNADLKRNTNIDLIIRPGDNEFRVLVTKARNIICRSGYSTIMDLLALGRTSLLIPTPGQTEQEYLAAHLQKFGFTYLTQSKMGGFKSVLQLPFSAGRSKFTNGEDFNLITEIVAKEINQIE